MAAANSNTENEIKLRIPGADEGRSRLEAAGLRLSVPRVFESNTIYDSPEKTLRERQSLIRLRRAGRRALLTFKGPATGGRHKTREERETAVEDADAMHAILERLGFEPAFRYEKYRTEFQPPEKEGTATVDETPIGCFLELEGPPDWVDRTAAALGFTAADYIPASYAALYFEWCSEHGIEPRNMVFENAGR